MKQVPEEFEDFIIEYGLKISNEVWQGEKLEMISRFVGDFMSSLGKFCNRIDNKTNQNHDSK